MFFPTYNVKFERGAAEEAIIASGEITNDSNSDYNLAMFKMVIYSKNQAIGTGVVKIHDFKMRTTKAFRVLVDAHYKLIPSIVRFELVMERGY